MSIYKELSVHCDDIETVRGIQFSVLSPDEIVKRSVVEITKSDTYAGSEPVIGGLFDSRMGVIEHNAYCTTCESKNVFCPGHFGHITFAKPVYHAMFFNHVKKVLRCVCHRCSRLLASPESTLKEVREGAAKAQQAKSAAKRQDAMVAVCDNTRLKRCGDDMAGGEAGGRGAGCGALIPSKYVKDGALKIVVEWKEKDVEAVRRDYSAEEVLRIFHRITDADMEFLGFNPRWNRPEWMIATVMPVPPPAVRPSIIEDNGQRREDDLTHKLSDIIKVNTQLRQRIERGTATEEYLRLTVMVLQYHYATFLDNQIPGLPPAQQRNGRRLKSVSDRLKKKEGRIRGNLNGKRVDQSARSVITPDPYISVDELGVPVKIAMNVTFPETVNAHNIEAMRALVRRGPDDWPGAKYVRSLEEGKTFTLRFEGTRDTIAASLREGDVVMRHLRNGDNVLFNRQPSLHKMSMMCHRAIVMPYQTFRLPIAVTPSYNADFDGDEMNLHCAQSLQTVSELMDFAAVPFHILTPKDGKPIVQVVQDTMLGSYRITQPHTRIHDKAFANLQMVNSYFDGILPAAHGAHGADRHHFTGRQAFSLILPPDLDLDATNKQKGRVRIRDGRIADPEDEDAAAEAVANAAEGVVDKDVYNAMSRGLLPVLYHDYGPFEVRRFLDNVQRLVCRWLLTAGFSVGISDLVVDDKVVAELTKLTDAMKAEAAALVHKALRGELDNASMFRNGEFFEREMMNILNDNMMKAGQVGLKTIDDRTNRLINMVKSGAKGKDLNISQMVAAVGQQNVEGKRVGNGFTDRTLPHFCKFDDGPEARGYVGNSFISGLSPHEMFFHAMGGREGLIDTAVKTSETGYIQRRLVKAMEDAKIYYDATVRNAAGSILQFLYGEDGMEGTHIERQRVPTAGLNVFDLDRAFRLRTGDNLELHLTREAFEALKQENWPAACDAHFERLLADRALLVEQVWQGRKNDRVLYPIPFERILRAAARRAADLHLDSLPSDLTPGAILTALDALVEELNVSRVGCALGAGRPAGGTPTARQGTFFAEMLARAYLSPKPLLLQYHMRREVFEWVLAEVRRCFKEAVAPAGEMVGIVAAQSIGEVQTQLSLDSFHVSGTAAAVKATSGVPRMKELLAVSKNIKTPSLLIHLAPDLATVVNADASGEDGSVAADPRVKAAKERALAVLRSLEITRVQDVVDATEVFYDPAGEDGLDTSLAQDAAFLETYRAFKELVAAPSAGASPWVLRVRVNKARLHGAGLTMSDLYLRLHAAYAGVVDAVFTDDNAAELVMRCRLVEQADPSAGAAGPADDQVAGLKALEQSLVARPIKGVEKIKKVSMHTETQELYNPQTQEYDRVTEWVLDTDGSNLLEILSNPNVDATRTACNDPREICGVLGIEAARASLCNEIMEVIRESSINYRHVSLLVDTITHRGTLMSIDRHGINRGDVGPLAKSSFEETTDMLINASVFAEYDKINGVSANIMLGQLPPCGTGDSEILLDEDAYLEAVRAVTRARARPPPPRREAAAEADGTQPADAAPQLLAGPHFKYRLPQRQDVGNAFALPVL